MSTWMELAERFVKATEDLAAAQKQIAEAQKEGAIAYAKRMADKTGRENELKNVVAKSAAGGEIPTSGEAAQPTAPTTPPAEPLQTPPEVDESTLDRKGIVSKLAIFGYVLPPKTRTTTLNEVLIGLQAGDAKVIEKYQQYKVSVGVANPPAQPAAPAPKCVACNDTGLNSKGEPCPVCRPAAAPQQPPATTPPAQPAPEGRKATVEEARAALVSLRDRVIAKAIAAGKGEADAKAEGYTVGTGLVKKLSGKDRLAEISDVLVFGQIVDAAGKDDNEF